MKKILFLFCFTRRSLGVGGLIFMLVFTSHSSSAQGVWTWMSGDTVINSLGVFGTQGVPSINNDPPAVLDPYSWTDLQGNFWLYGGSDNMGNIYGDMWKFNPITLEWTWVNGIGKSGVTPVYGTMGVTATGNTPGSRKWSSCTWVDTAGDLWLYGGFFGGALADLWKYNIASNEWTWMSGADTLNSVPVYGIKGVPSLSNNSGSRFDIGSPWIDVNGKFWLFGGNVNNGAAYSDMWMYDPLTNMWAWGSGSQVGGTLPIYGSKNIFSATNTPGGRFPFAMLTEDNGNFLLFGGYGGSAKVLADLWEYNPAINQWAWVNGAQNINAPGVEGTICQSDSTFYPASRFFNCAVWSDCDFNFWMYGGWTNDMGLSFGDVWVYLVGAKEWSRMSDSNYINSNPVYGSLGVPKLSNQPGSRYGSAHWKDKNSNFWIFGGNQSGVPSYGNTWRYVPDSICVNSKCSIATNDYPVSSSVSFQLYPNPAENQLTVSSKQLSGSQLEIIDLLGRTLLTQTISSNTTQQTIDVSKLVDGVYFIAIKNAEGMVGVKKFVKE